MKESNAIPGNIKDLLSYNPETGDFFWKISRGRSKAGNKAGSIRNDGFIYIGISEKIFTAQRLAWFLFHGQLLCGHIHHLNGERGDNRINNLFPQIIKDSLPGAVFDRSTRRWQAKIEINKKTMCLGLFDNQIEAYKAYMEKKKEVWDIL